MVRPVRIALALAVGLTLAASDWVPAADAAQLKEVAERVFPFEQDGELTIESQNGRITVEAWNRPEARIQITREVRASDDERAAELMRELRAEVTLAKGRIEVKSRYPKRTESVGILEVLGQRVSALNIHYYVQVPTRTRLVLQTSNGELRVRGTSAYVVGQTVNGNVEVASTAGHVEVSTTNGAIKLSGIDGSARAGTTNGGIDAEFRSLDPDVGIDLHTTNGNLVASLPADLKAVLEAMTTNGRVSIDFPIEKVGVKSSKVVQGRIGGGGVVVKLRTTNGNIAVKRVGKGKS
jgi:DUF4097 and DUF4098 domain-containing protein YvlB